MVDYEYSQKLANFKFGVFAPAISESFEQCSRAAFFRAAAEKEYTLPDGTKTRFSAKAIATWYYRYKKSGIEALMPSKRSDIGSTRVIKKETISRVYELKKKYPYITGTAIYNILLSENLISIKDVSLSTLHRFLKNNIPKSDIIINSDPVKSFQMEFSNQCWQADTTYLFHLNLDGQRKQLYLVAIIDDKSRLPVHAEIFIHDNAVNFQKVLKKAIAKYGLPEKLFCDNGKPYANTQLNYICSNLNVNFIHATVAAGAAKGKIERFFNTVKKQWMTAGIDYNSFKSLDEVNESFNNYLSNKYCSTIHSAIGKTPRESFMEDMNRIKYIPGSDLFIKFLHQIDRKVSNDALVSVNKTQFEVPQKYINQKITLKYDPLDLSKIWVYVNGELIDESYPVNKVDNASIPRSRSKVKYHDDSEES